MPDPHAADPVSALVFEPLADGLPRNGLWVGRIAVLPAGLTGNGPPAVLSAPARKSGQPPAVFTLVSGEGWTRTPCSFPLRPYDYGPAHAGDLTGDGQLEIALGAHLRGLDVLASANDESGCAWTTNDAGLPTGVQDAPRVSVGALAHTIDDDGLPLLWLLPDIPSSETDTRGLRAFSYVDGGWQRQMLDDAISRKIGAGLATGRWSGRQWLLVASRDVNDREVLVEQGKKGKWSPARIDGWPDYDRLFHDAVGSRRLRDGRHAPLLSYRYARDGQWYRRLVQLIPGDSGAWRQQIIDEAATRTAFTAIAAARLPGSSFGDDIVAATEEGAWYLFRQTTAGFERRVDAPATWRSGCRAQGMVAVDIVGDTHDELIIHYATDPSAYDLSRPCPSQGGIEAWRVSVGSASGNEH